MADVRCTGGTSTAWCPRAPYPESENPVIRRFQAVPQPKLREFAAGAAPPFGCGASEDELRALKDEYMGTVYRICAVALGEPPEKFDFFAPQG